tara:strand:- start:882 stop:1004 length:123 start_codon:yes stop_codon:yes gene_type:complete
MWQLKDKYKEKVLLFELTEDNIKIMEKYALETLEKYCIKI